MKLIKIIGIFVILMGTWNGELFWKFATIGLTIITLDYLIADIYHTHRNKRIDSEITNTDIPGGF